MNKQIQNLIAEADALSTVHPSKDCRVFADQVSKVLSDLYARVKRYQTARKAMDKFNADRATFSGSIVERNAKNLELYDELLAAREGLMGVE